MNKSYSQTVALDNPAISHREWHGAQGGGRPSASYFEKHARSEDLGSVGHLRQKLLKQKKKTCNICDKIGNRTFSTKSGQRPKNR